MTVLRREPESSFSLLKMRKGSTKLLAYLRTSAGQVTYIFAADRDASGVIDGADVALLSEQSAPTGSCVSFKTTAA
jgi:hypothetical protein